MKLYDKLSSKFPANYFSLSTTQTLIEEDDPQAVTRSIIFEHNGTEVLKINKTLLVAVRDATTSSSLSEVCDGAIVTETPSHFVGYVELKSACTTNNVLKARSQILASHELLQTACISCTYSIDSFIQNGIIVTQPITDETLTKARQRRKRDDDSKVTFSSARFFLNLISGKAKDDTTGIQFIHVVSGEIIALTDILL